MQLPANGRRNQIRILGISDKGLSFVKGPQYLHFVIEQFEIEHFEVLLHAFDVRRLGDNDHVRLNLEAQYHLAHRLVIAAGDILQCLVSVDFIDLPCPNGA